MGFITKVSMSNQETEAAWWGSLLWALRMPDELLPYKFWETRCESLGNQRKLGCQRGGGREKPQQQQMAPISGLFVCCTFIEGALRFLNDEKHYASRNREQNSQLEKGTASLDCTQRRKKTAPLSFTGEWIFHNSYMLGFVQFMEMYSQDSVDCTTLCSPFRPRSKAHAVTGILWSTVQTTSLPITRRERRHESVDLAPSIQLPSRPHA